MSKSSKLLFVIVLCSASSLFANTADSFIGRWALTIPNGQAGWLSIADKGNYFDGSILWGGGSVIPLDSVYFQDDQLFVTRLRKISRRNTDRKIIRTHNFTETIIADVSGDKIKLTRIMPQPNGKGIRIDSFTGKRIPPLPPKPDLSRAKRGKTIELFNGNDLDGWKLIGENRINGWSVRNGILVNNTARRKGQHGGFGNLRTVEEFEDFNIKLQVKGSKGFNSGVYLRGVYEVQVADSFGKKTDSHNMGAVYSRITPLHSAEKPAGQWQTLDITLLDRHITVILNGKKIIDNQPLMGCTGGALWSDELRPGPIYLQGDHTGIEYKNIKLTPLKSSK